MPADYTPDSLSSLLLTNSDVNSVVGPDDMVTDNADVPAPSDSTVRVGRIYKTNKGLAVVTLFANADGSAPSSDALNQVMGGSYLNSLANVVFSSTGSPMDGGSAGLADQDRIISFQAQLNGATWDTWAVLFAKGSVYGVVLWSSPVNDPITDSLLEGFLYTSQVFKLP
jgi:hypothetical protein